MSDDDIDLDTFAWLRAIVAADKWRSDDPDDRDAPSPVSDLRPIVELLRSKCPLTDEARRLLIDLFERHRLSMLPGKNRPIPAHRHSSWIDAELELAAEEYHRSNWRKSKLSREQVIKRIADDWKMDVRRLRAHLDGKRGSSRRK